MTDSREKHEDHLFSTTLFESLDLQPDLLRGVRDLGFKQLTHVQDRVLPVSLAGRDVVAQAQTGSGKTAAYLLTAYQRLLAKPRPEASPGDPRCLVITPTRELAVQVSRDAEGLGIHTDIKVHVVFGGLDYKKQRATLSEGVDILVGTPGRLIDYHQQGAYSLRDTEIVIIDECDRLFDMGFAEDLRWLLHRLPHPRDRQTLMFSATLSRRVTRIGWREMNDPLEIVIDSEQLTPDTIHQELYHVAAHEKLSLLLGLLKREGESRTMIFVNTRVAARHLVEDLERNGYRARGLTGNVEQIRRLRVLDQFRDGNLPILVATDVASRGLHIDGVSHVINFDLPQDPEDYVHRIGRTARVGAEGKAFTLACENYIYSLDAIQKFVGYDIPVVFADDDLYLQPKPRIRKPRPSGGTRRSSSQRAPSSKGSNKDNRSASKPRRRRRRPSASSSPPKKSSGNDTSGSD